MISKLQDNQYVVFVEGRNTLKILIAQSGTPKAHWPGHILLRGRKVPDGTIWEVENSEARQGYGPLLYDLAMEVVSSHYGDLGIVHDSVTVSNAAQNVWKYYYEKRSDVEKEKLPFKFFPFMSDSAPELQHYYYKIESPFLDNFEASGQVKWVSEDGLSESAVLKKIHRRKDISTLYHATQPTRLEKILQIGLTDQASSKFSGNLGQRGVSATTDFSVVSNGSFGNLILVLDPYELHDYELVPTDYWGDNSEKEVRIVGPASGPTIVPSNAIKRLIFITPKLPGFEIRHIQQFGIPISTFWRGEMKQLSESRKAPQGGTALLCEYIREMMEADFGEKVWAKRAPSGSRHQGEEPDTAIEGKLYTAIKWFLDKGNTQLWDEEAKLAFHQATMDPRYNDVFKYETSGKLYRGMRVSGPWAVEKASGVPDAVWMQNLHSQTNSKRTRGALKNVSEMIPTSKVYVPTARSNGFSSWTPDFEQAKKFASQVQDNQSSTEMGIILVADASGGNFLDMSAIYDFEGLGNFRGEQERISVGDVQLEGAHFVQPSKPRNWI